MWKCKESDCLHLLVPLQQQQQPIKTALGKLVSSAAMQLLTFLVLMCVAALYLCQTPKFFQAFLLCQAKEGHQAGRGILISWKSQWRALSTCAHFPYCRQEMRHQQSCNCGHKAKDFYSLTSSRKPLCQHFFFCRCQQNDSRSIQLADIL